jgi:hypothetical protein
MRFISTSELNELVKKLSEIEEFNKKLYKWAEFTLEYCNEVAKIKNRAFFAFQSTPKFKPEVLVLGLNPARNDTFADQISNENWKIKDFGKMSPEIFLQQNPWYNGGEKDEKGDWNILKKLNKTIEVHSDLLSCFDSLVYMNILYFNSTDFNEFKKHFGSDWEMVYLTCISLTEIVIFEIIKPKTIICLGISNCFRSIVSNSQSLELLNGSLYKSSVKSINVYGMTHPSARITNNIREEIGWSLYSDWFNIPIKSKLKGLLSKIKAILLEIARDNNLTLDFECINNLGKFSYFKFYFIQNSNISLYFEFQKGYYNDLRYALNNKEDKALLNSITCEKPFDNWNQLISSFDEKKFKEYFDKIITNQTKIIHNLI